MSRKKINPFDARKENSHSLTKRAEFPTDPEKDPKEPENKKTAPEELPEPPEKLPGAPKQTVRPRIPGQTPESADVPGYTTHHPTEHTGLSPEEFKEKQKEPEEGPEEEGKPTWKSIGESAKERLKQYKSEEKTKQRLEEMYGPSEQLQEVAAGLGDFGRDVATVDIEAAQNYIKNQDLPELIQERLEKLLRGVRYAPNHPLADEKGEISITGPRVEQHVLNQLGATTKKEIKRAKQWLENTDEGQQFYKRARDQYLIQTAMNLLKNTILKQEGEGVIPMGKRPEKMSPEQKAEKKRIDRLKEQLEQGVITPEQFERLLKGEEEDEEEKEKTEKKSPHELKPTVETDPALQQLNQLQQQFNKGAISEEEYRRERARLLRESKRLNLRRYSNTEGPGGDEWWPGYESGPQLNREKYKKKNRFPFNNEPSTDIRTNKGPAKHDLPVPDGGAPAADDSWGLLAARETFKKTGDNDLFECYSYGHVTNGPWFTYTLFKRAYEIFRPGDIAVQYGQNPRQIQSYRRRFGSIKKARTNLNAALFPAVTAVRQVEIDLAKNAEVKRVSPDDVRLPGKATPEDSLHEVQKDKGGPHPAVYGPYTGPYDEMPWQGNRDGFDRPAPRKKMDTERNVFPFEDSEISNQTKIFNNSGLKKKALEEANNYGEEEETPRPKENIIPPEKFTQTLEELGTSPAQFPYALVQTPTQLQMRWTDLPEGVEEQWLREKTYHHVQQPVLAWADINTQEDKSGQTVWTIGDIQSDIMQRSREFASDYRTTVQHAFEEIGKKLRKAFRTDNVDQAKELMLRALENNPPRQESGGLHQTNNEIDTEYFEKIQNAISRATTTEQLQKIINKINEIAGGAEGYPVGTRSKIEKYYRNWDQELLKQLVLTAQAQGVDVIRIPTPEERLEAWTDGIEDEERHSTLAQLFTRIYGDNIKKFFPNAEKVQEGRYWEIPLASVTKDLFAARNNITKLSFTAPNWSLLVLARNFDMCRKTAQDQEYWKTYAVTYMDTYIQYMQDAAIEEIPGIDSTSKYVYDAWHELVQKLPEEIRNSPRLIQQIQEHVVQHLSQKGISIPPELQTLPNTQYEKERLPHPGEDFDLPGNMPPGIAKKLNLRKKALENFEEGENSWGPEGPPWERAQQDIQIKRSKASDPNTPPDVLAELSKDPDEYVRKHVARNPNTPIEVLKEFRDGPDDVLRKVVTHHPKIRDLEAPTEPIDRLDVYNINYPAEYALFWNHDKFAPLFKLVNQVANYAGDVAGTKVPKMKTREDSEKWAEIYSQVFSNYLRKYPELLKIAALQEILSADNDYNALTPAEVAKSLVGPTQGFGTAGRPEAIPQNIEKFKNAHPELYDATQQALQDLHREGWLTHETVPVYESRDYTWYTTHRRPTLEDDPGYMELHKLFGTTPIRSDIYTEEDPAALSPTGGFDPIDAPEEAPKEWQKESPPQPRKENTRDELFQQHFKDFNAQIFENLDEVRIPVIDPGLRQEDFDLPGNIPPGIAKKLNLRKKSDVGNYAAPIPETPEERAAKPEQNVPKPLNWDPKRPVKEKRKRYDLNESQLYNQNEHASDPLIHYTSQQKYAFDFQVSIFHPRTGAFVDETVISANTLAEAQERAQEFVNKSFPGHSFQVADPYNETPQTLNMISVQDTNIPTGAAKMRSLQKHALYDLGHSNQLVHIYLDTLQNHPNADLKDIDALTQSALDMFSNLNTNISPEELLEIAHAADNMLNKSGIPSNLANTLQGKRLH